MSEFAGRIFEVTRRFTPQWGVVLGSGLGGLMDALEVTREFALEEIEGLPAPRVEGHAGRLLLGMMGGQRVAAFLGRCHLYEGYEAREVTAGIRFLAATGVRRLILSNAAGSLKPEFAPGRWMLIRDHLNLTGASPLAGSARFVDMTEAYSSALGMQFAKAARDAEESLCVGVYAGVRGPQYETPAEVAMLHRLGADAVGMSTVLEAIEARAAGLEVAGLSLLTNWGAGLGDQLLNHEDVMATGAAASTRMGKVLARVIALADASDQPGTE